MNIAELAKEAANAMNHLVDLHSYYYDEVLSEDEFIEETRTAAIKAKAAREAYFAVSNGAGIPRELLYK